MYRLRIQARDRRPEECPAVVVSRIHVIGVVEDADADVPRAIHGRGLGDRGGVGRRRRGEGREGRERFCGPAHHVMC